MILVYLASDSAFWPLKGAAVGFMVTREIVWDANNKLSNMHNDTPWEFRELPCANPVT